MFLLLVISLSMIMTVILNDMIVIIVVTIMMLLKIMATMIENTAITNIDLSLLSL